MRREWFISLALALITIAVFWPVDRCQFLDCDDLTSVVANPDIQQGLTLAGVAWAFKAVVVSNWHPMTCLSHMLDCQLFGNDPAGHHLVNLLFHVANTVLLFQLLRQGTREFWPSACVAALFAWHPLHVESVAWISERKDVLSAFFGFLALRAYVNYARSATRKPGARVSSYFLAIVFYAFGLMSKPMLVSWPFVLLLLDFWPLQRIASSGVQVPGDPISAPPSSTWKRLLAEKLPFLVLAIASAVVTFVVQRHSAAMVSVDSLSVPERIDNALIAYVRYAGKTFWPARLAVFYPYPATWPAWQVLGSAVLLALITAATVRQTRRRPFLIVGWLWFLGTLVPVIGLVQVGSQSMADRYSYIPQIGLFLMIVWGATDFARSRPWAKIWLAGAAAATLATCVVVTRVQLRYWQNTETLMRHALDVTANNAKAQAVLGSALIGNGRIQEGLAHLNEALRIEPDFTEIHCRVAEALAHQGNARGAADHYYAALRFKPDLPEALNNLAWILATNEDPKIRNGAEAVRFAERACALTQEQTTLYLGTLAAAYAEIGRFEDAVRTAERAWASAIASGDKALAAKNRRLLDLYRAGQPCRETTGTSL